MYLITRLAQDNLMCFQWVFSSTYISEMHFHKKTQHRERT